MIEPPQGDANNFKTQGLYIVLIGMACSIFVAVKIKRKVDEINKAAEEKTQ